MNILSRWGGGVETSHVDTSVCGWSFGSFQYQINTLIYLFRCVYVSNLGYGMQIRFVPFGDGKRTNMFDWIRSESSKTQAVRHGSVANMTPHFESNLILDGSNGSEDKRMSACHASLYAGQITLVRVEWSARDTWNMTVEIFGRGENVNVKMIHATVWFCTLINEQIIFTNWLQPFCRAYGLCSILKITDK